MSTTDTRAAFEEWAKDEGLIQESHGIMSVSSMCNVARKAFDAGIAHAEAAKATGAAGALIVPEPQPTEGYRTDFNKGYSQGFNACRAKVLENCASNCTTLDTCRNYGCAEAVLCAPDGESWQHKFEETDRALLYWKAKAKQAEAARQPAPVLSQGDIHLITCQEVRKIGSPLVDKVPADCLTALGRAIAERVLAATNRSQPEKQRAAHCPNCGAHGEHLCPAGSQP